MRKIKELYKQYKQIINYLIVGGCTTLVSLATFFVATFFLDASNIVQLQIANIISWICAVSFAYITNRKYVFESKDHNKWKEALKFVTSRLSTLVIEMIIMTILVSFMKWNENAAKLIVQVIVIVLNYVFSKFFVFTQKR